jgi:hypothetical protein
MNIDEQIAGLKRARAQLDESIEGLEAKKRAADASATSEAAPVAHEQAAPVPARTPAAARAPAAAPTTTGPRLTQQTLFGGQAPPVREDKGNWAPHDERYLELLKKHGQPCSGNESGLKAFSEAFPTRTDGSIKGHISVFNVQDYKKWQQGEGQGKWGGWDGWRKK